jgi:3-oxoacyl-[acyl-carrier protein] reductase
MKVLVPVKRVVDANVRVRVKADGWAVAVNYAHDSAGADRVVGEIAMAGGRAFAARFSVIDENQIAKGVEAIA